MASFTVTPAAPPKTADGLNAPKKICATADGRRVILQRITIRLPAIYTSAIKGTSFSTTAARRLVPPINTNRETTARKRPTVKGGIEIFREVNTWLNAVLIELDWTILPINPSARIKKIANTNAKDLAEKTLKCSMDIINRTTGHFPMLYGFIILCKSSFCVNGCHAKKSGHPHPEDSARAAAIRAVAAPVRFPVPTWAAIAVATD